MKRYTPIKLKSPTAKGLPHARRQPLHPKIAVAASNSLEVLPWSKRGRVTKTHPHWK